LSLLGERVLEVTKPDFCLVELLATEGDVAAAVEAERQRLTVGVDVGDGGGRGA
jgi:hypothetical protein